MASLAVPAHREQLRREQRTEYEEGIDLDQSQLNGVSNSTLSTFGGGIASIDSTQLPAR